MNGSRRQRVEQDASQFTAMHLGAATAAIVGLIEKHGALRVEHARRFTALMDDSTEFVEQSGRLERELSVVVVDIEHSALRARSGRGLRLVDGRGDAVNVQNASEHESTEPGANNCYWYHVVTFGDRSAKVAVSLWNIVPIQLGTAFQSCQAGAMAKGSRRSGRREDALSRDRIVEVAIELLDSEGEAGLTFRSLATRLATGPGALYWHVANKSELLIAASDALVARMMDEVLALTFSTPQEAIRQVAVGVFEAVDAHPWLGAQLSRAPWQTAMLQIFERVGRQVEVLGVRGGAQFTSASALVSYIIGVSVQNAANGRQFEPSVDRADFLEQMSRQWKQLDAHEYPFTRNVANRLREHDDSAEFLAGIDLILAGIAVSVGNGAG